MESVCARQAVPRVRIPPSPPPRFAHARFTGTCAALLHARRASRRRGRVRTRAGGWVGGARAGRVRSRGGRVVGATRAARPPAGAVEAGWRLCDAVDARSAVLPQSRPKSGACMGSAAEPSTPLEDRGIGVDRQFAGVARTRPKPRCAILVLTRSQPWEARSPGPARRRPRTSSGPEGSSDKGITPGAAVPPGSLVRHGITTGLRGPGFGVRTTATFGTPDGG